ncbi:hypothetical protein E4U54_008062 [Claviceps lovelessii]|nr:hypothetical protein E4U54_008062 [Claviceps lovelessii]
MTIAAGQQQPLGSLDSYDAIDENEFLPRSSPPMEPRRTRFSLSPTPSLDIPASQVSLSPPPTGDGFQRSNRPKIVPIAGNSVLVAVLDDGRRPEIARAAGYQAFTGIGEEEEEDKYVKKGTGDGGGAISILSGHHKDEDARPVHSRSCGSAPRSSTSDIDGPRLRNLAADALQAVCQDSEPVMVDGKTYDIAHTTSHLSLDDDRSTTKALPPHKDPPETNATSESFDRASIAETSNTEFANDKLAPIRESKAKCPELLPSIRNILDGKFPFQLSAMADKANNMVSHGSEAPFTPPSSRKLATSSPISPNGADQRSLPSPYPLPASSSYPRHTSNGSSQQPSTESGPTVSSETPAAKQSAPTPTTAASVPDRISVKEVTSTSEGRYVSMSECIMWTRTRTIHYYGRFWRIARKALDVIGEKEALELQNPDYLI